MKIKRLYVHERIYHLFLQKIIAFAKAVKAGNGMEGDVLFGPAQDEVEFEEARDLFSSTTAEKLKAALGGSIEYSKAASSTQSSSTTNMSLPA